MPSLMKVENIVKDYHTGNFDLRVLKGVSLEVNEGEIMAIVGPSGAGKSTLLHIMGLIDCPTEGNVLFRGEALSALSPSARSTVRNRDFGFIFQMYHLMPEFNVLENTLLPLMIRNSIGGWILHRGSIRRRAVDLLEKVGLGRRLKHRPNQLSGGERQRVAIARALVNDPAIVFCDEPTGNLDHATADEILQLILRLNKETGKTFIVVTHDSNVASLANRRLTLVDGSLAQS